MGIYQIIPSKDHGQPAAAAVAGLPGSDADALESALADMTATFSSDFCHGRIGEHHNTYQHRSRVLRQMAGRLATMRARDLGVTI